MNVVKLFLLSLMLLLTIPAYAAPVKSAQQVKTELVSYCESKAPLTSTVNKRDADMFCSNQSIITFYKYAGYASLVLSFLAVIWVFRFFIRLYKAIMKRNRVSRKARKAAKRKV